MMVLINTYEQNNTFLLAQQIASTQKKKNLGGGGGLKMCLEVMTPKIYFYGKIIA